MNTDWVDVALQEIDALIERTEKKRDRKTLGKAYRVVEAVARREWDEIAEAGPPEARHARGLK